MREQMESNSLIDRQAPPQGVGLSHLADAEAGREAVRIALAGHEPTAEDLIILFTTVDRDVEALYRAAVAEAAPAGVCGCSSTGGFTQDEQVPSGCVAALLAADDRRFGICHVERDEDDIADSARRAAQGARDRAGKRHPHSVLLLLTDGMIRDQREIARGAYEVTTAVTPFVGGVAGDALTWDCTYTFGDGRLLTNGIVAVWINSERPMGVSVDHGWRPAGRPMLVTRAEGTVVHELDGTPALEAYMAERGSPVDPRDPGFFLKVIGSPVGLPNARGQYDVRQLHAYLPEGGGINFNAGVSEQSILQVMSADDEGLIEGARRAAAEAVSTLTEKARIVLVFSCGSRVALLGDRVRDEVVAISSALDGVPVCGFYTYGEFARTAGSSGFHNSSVSVLAL
jgi:hypothetical protein